MRECCCAGGRGAVEGGAGGHGKVGAGRARGRDGAQRAGGREVVADAGSASSPFSSVACGEYCVCVCVPLSLCVRLWSLCACVWIGVCV